MWPWKHDHETVAAAPQFKQRLGRNPVPLLVHNLDGQLFEELMRQRICKSTKGLHAWLLVPIRIIHVFPQVNRHLLHVLVKRIPITQEVLEIDLGTECVSIRCAVG